MTGIRRSFLSELISALLAFVASGIALLVCAPILIVGVPIVFIASLTRLLEPVIRKVNGAPVVAHWWDLITYEPVVGWKPLPNIRAWAASQADSPFLVTTDEDGWRGSAPLADADCVVFGDSFAFGFGVGDDEVFSALVPGGHVKSIGANGYDMVQGLLWMERLAGRLEDKVVIWMLYYANDLYDNLLPNMGPYRKPFVRRSAAADGWEVVSRHVGPEPWRFPPQKNDLELLREICSDTPLSERVFGAVDFLIDRASKVCEQAGARLVVLGAPDGTQLVASGTRSGLGSNRWSDSFAPLRPDIRLGEICEARGAGFVALSGCLTARDYLIGDCHWNALGHRKVAEAVARVLTEADHSRDRERGGFPMDSSAARVSGAGPSG